jgi:hypothetical protein
VQKGHFRWHFECRNVGSGLKDIRFQMAFSQPIEYQCIAMGMMGMLLNAISLAEWNTLS